MILIDGKKIAAELREELRHEVLELTYRLTDPILFRIRRFLPNLGSLDISPIILLLLIWFIEMCMKLYIAPMIF